ncbi:hypothetical protein WT60_19530 [Burkholderia sp. MSMB617WGS]|nr:hypothetical protein WS78_29705 [Burkholderia savannae]AOK49155.1 hypothetical protein WT60_19530 [Burkholderia sp. MSMB617WGS]KVG44922.1 hypothetical protein WS77_07040 [Burkholderia sp. MSMB0265]KVG89910.1 hypothetical protein WS81_19275 [Burkholderia sp. MSMB2040]KVG96047.1 hypothetical protein WS82_02450 [Burkholderia sp. MSMB2041]KVG99674.1 hypothetical protein WS83_24485 [Burkholderia sp. MSMB2042]
MSSCGEANEAHEAKTRTKRNQRACRSSMRTLDHSSPSFHAVPSSDETPKVKHFIAPLARHAQGAVTTPSMNA